MTSSAVVPINSLTSNHGFDTLNTETYTAHRLKHASPEHLHRTTQRFFIGPIPEGWLNSNRKSWYKRRLELSTYSSRKASFNAAADSGPHHRTRTGLTGPSTAARMSFSFPQPEDVHDTASASENTEADESDGNETDEAIIEPTDVEPVSTRDVPQITGMDEEDEEENASRPKAVPIPSKKRTEDSRDTSKLLPQASGSTAKSPGKETFVTAHEEPVPESGIGSPALDSAAVERSERDDQRFSSSNRNSLLPESMIDIEETSSQKPLIRREQSEGKSKTIKSANKFMQQHDPAPIEGDDPGARLGRSNTGVRFKVAEGVAERQHRIGRRVEFTRERVVNKNFRRNTLREGTIVKMERMLIRIDTTVQEIPEEFDENESIKLETRVSEKWREFMVVVRKNKKEDADDFRLQMYKTRVIPEIEDESTKKKPRHEIRLDSRTTHINLYSSLDKTVVLWHSYKKGSRIVVMKPTSTAHSVEWYTFLRDALGWHRPANLKIDVPDLDVQLRLERPFDGLEAAVLNAQDEETALAQTVAAEQAVAGRIIDQCVGMLEGDPEWANVLKKWHESAKMGLAWKRYDRLEWVHGLNEQKMYGSMAMQHSHELELRPKEHYPTTAHGKKGKVHQEPTPVEGFLIRLTSQKGIHQRFGKTFFKRLYFSTQNQFLLFNRPAKATPPHPPRLATISGHNIPSSHEIVEKTPMMYDIEPFKCQNGRIVWLSAGNLEYILRHDREALEESRRNIANVTDADGYINMCNIVKVRPFQWGALPADEQLEPGSDSDVDFHQEVSNTLRPDGSTKEVDDNRIFELVLQNGLIIRLQAYSKETRDEWIRRLRKLTKYWSLRTKLDMETYKAVRRANLQSLDIDEDLESLLGQFGRKWEVSRSQASSEIFNLCPISACRTLVLSGHLYRKPRRRSTFQRCSVILPSGSGQLLIFQSSLRARVNGEEIKHAHHEKQATIELKDCYVYSGLIVEDDLLYQNRTFDPNYTALGMGRLPRVYLEDGWTSTDVDVMTCFVLWINQRKSWFRTPSAFSLHSSDKSAAGGEDGSSKKGRKRARLRRVGQLGVPGRGMVFKCRSRAERDHWVLNLAGEIDRVVDSEWQRQRMRKGTDDNDDDVDDEDAGGDVRFQR